MMMTVSNGYAMYVYIIHPNNHEMIATFYEIRSTNVVLFFLFSIHLRLKQDKKTHTHTQLISASEMKDDTQT